MNSKFPELSKVLAVLLVEQGSYTYIDKLAQSSSKDLALYHIREALRDYHSLMNSLKSKEVMSDEDKEVKFVMERINFSEVENEIKELSEIATISHLRERVSLISSQALAEAARIKSKKE